MKVTVHSKLGPRSLDFPGNPTVAEVLKKTFETLDLPPRRHYGLLLSGNATTPLRPDRTLGSYDIREGSTLYLTITRCGMADGNGAENASFGSGESPEWT
ncbi:MAG: hypothetical protein EPN47_19780 [Acidobacteria bacterium]|nr:MAG: hypothetical protein EPN47_19780 [Acidobacteriota bacterium]